MNTSVLKKKLSKSIASIDDAEFLHALKVIIDDRNKTDERFELSSSQRRELERRIESIHNGTAKLISWNEVKRNARRALKSVKQK